MKRTFTSILLSLSFLLLISPVSAQYCTPVHSVTCAMNLGSPDFRDSDIRKFTFSSLQNNHTNCNTGAYTTFPDTGNLTTSVYAGQTVPFYIQGGFVNPTHFAIWVDWNNDSAFATTEMIWSSPAVNPIGSHALYGYITIPAGVSPGKKRMRVRAAFATNSILNTEACTNLTGETEDYTITVSSPASMSIKNIGATPVTRDLLPGMTKSKMLLVNISTGGINAPMNLTQLTFSLTGSTPATAIKNAKIFWSGSLTSYDSLLRNAAQIGSTVTTVSSGISFTGLNQALNTGNNYVWLTFDLDTGVALNTTFSAKLDDCKINGSSAAIGSTPAGSRRLVSYNNYQYYTASPAVKVKGGSTPGPNNYGVGGLNFAFDGQIDNNTGDLDTIAFYAGGVANVNRTGTYNYSGRAGVQPNLQNYIMWVDWDNDGIYDPATEEVGFGTGITAYSGALTVPCAAAIGPHRVRVSSDFMANYWSLNFNNFSAAIRPKPNEPLLAGDIEEYTLNILADLQPSAFFTHDSVGYRNGFTKFFDKSTGIGNVLEWDFTNDGITDATSSNPVFQYTTGGWKRVTLKITNSGCSGVVTKSYTDSVFIVNPVGLPTADWVVNRNITDINLPVKFTDKSFQGPTVWTWVITPATVNGFPSHQYVNGTGPNTQHPEIQFLAAGIYTVKLTVSNVNGSSAPEERVDYIRVLEPDNMCGSFVSSENINGFLYDDGGADANYSDFGGTAGQLCGFLIEPSTCVDEIFLHWNDFDINLYGSSGCPNLPGDVIRVYDGKDNTGISLHGQAGFPNGFTNGANNAPIIPPDLVAKSGAVYIEFFKNCSFNGRGFGLEWFATPDISKPFPDAKAIVPDSVYIGQILDFKAVQNEPGLKFYWDAENDGIIDWNDSVFTTGFNTPGFVTVVMLAENCSGIDSFIKVIKVIAPGVPVAQFEADRRQLLFGEKVQFTDLSGKAIFDWSWTVDRSADVEFTDNTEFFSPNPVIRFNAAGFYTIDLNVMNVDGSAFESKAAYIEVIGNAPCYPAANFNNDIGISRVRLEGIDNGSAIGASSYSNFVGNGEAVLEQGLSYAITLERITTFDRMSRAVWIDWNGDGDFDDTLELVAYEKPSRAKNFITTFQVPGSAVTHFGPVRMRVGASLGYDTLLACGSLTNIQEYEDYRVVIRPALPLITLTGNDTLFWDAGTTYTEPGYSATDYLGASITSNVLISGSVNVNLIGDYLLTYNVKDALGSSAVAKTRLVQVRDTIRPRISLVGKDTLRLQVGYPLANPGITVTDNLDPNSKVSTFDSLYLNQLGLWKIVYTAQDFTGNKSLPVTRYILVFDTIAPFVQLIGNDTVLVDVNTRFIDNGIFATDNYYSSSILVTTKTGSVDTSVVDNYTLTYSVKDGSGNQRTIKRIVKVVDRIAPQITVHDAIVIKPQSPKPTLADSVTITDNYYSTATLKPLLQITENIDMSMPGIYPVSYQVTDPSGNVSILAKSVVIVSPTAGVNNLLSGMISIYPNPSTDGRFMLTWNGDLPALSAEQVSVYNSIGQQVNFTATVSGEGLAIQLAEPAAGVYYIRINAGKENAVFKVVKQ